ncbi:hypothetical protein HDE_14101 [Halotydeus destructor]|nr:hypothetical protein HDE_14101 [Halotydeus destructor]
MARGRNKQASNAEFDVTISSTPPASNEQMDHRLLIARFTGSHDSSVRVESWVSMFELVTEEKTDHERLRALLRYLAGDAMNWFAEDVIPVIDTLTWASCKANLIARFCYVLVSPVLQAQKRYLRRSEDVLCYYNEKMQMLRQTGLSPLDQTAMLTEGMPQSFRTALISAQLKEPQAWLSVALQLESSSRTFKSSEVDRTMPQTNKIEKRSRPADNQRKPPRPCRFCKDLGKTEWHWHNECPNRKPDQRLETSVKVRDESVSHSGN